MKVQFIDLKRQYKSIAKEINRTIKKVTSSGVYVLGEDLRKFEKNFTRFCGTKYGVGVSSGTDAIFLSLLALNLKPGDEVITTPYTFIATVTPVNRLGLRVVFADVCEETFNINPEEVRKKITERTKVIMPVHIYGMPADMDGIMKKANEIGVSVIEDAAQAHGAKFKGKVVGGIGTIGCFSFYPTKNLGAYGDGGFVSTNNEQIANRIITLRNHGRINNYEFAEEGFTARLDNLQSAILDVKLKYINLWNKLRRKKAKLYFRLLKDLPVILPKEPKNVKSSYHIFAIRVPSDKRDHLHQYLQKNGIQTALHYYIPLHLQKALSHLGYREHDFKVAEKLAKEVLCLPLFPEITKKEIEYVCSKIRKFFSQKV